MNALFGQLGSASELDVVLSAPRVCMRCNALYCERENIGRWQCIEFHPLDNYMTVHDRTYPCCHQAVGSRGCVRADHTDELVYNCQPRLVDRAIMSLLGADIVDDRSWQLLDNGNYMVDRVDHEAYMDMCSAGGSTANHNQHVLVSPIKQRIF
jgi:hypothetical protein